MPMELKIDPTNVGSIFVYATAPIIFAVVAADSIASVQETRLLSHMDLLATKSTAAARKRRVHALASPESHARVPDTLPTSYGNSMPRRSISVASTNERSNSALQAARS